MYKIQLSEEMSASVEFYRAYEEVEKEFESMFAEEEQNMKKRFEEVKKTLVKKPVVKKEEQPQKVVKRL